MFLLYKADILFSCIEKGLVELRLKADVADNDEKKQLKKQIKNTEEAVQAMKIAMKSMKKFNSSFALGECIYE